MRQIMFAREFPAAHPRRGEPTRFPEKIWAALADMGRLGDQGLDFGNYKADWFAYYGGSPKLHTIRAGSRWKAGDWFVPKIWSGKPYRSKTIAISLPIEVRKVWTFEVDQCGVMSVGGWYAFDDACCAEIAANDGLTEEDFLCWFPREKAFSGQIICWSDKVDYSIDKLQPDGLA